MIYKNLGNTQTKISAIAQGTIGAGSRASTTLTKIQRRVDVLLAGIAEGITFLDTGEDYESGHAEEILGRTIKDIRKNVFISSKYKPANNSYDGVIHSAELSLKRLKTDYIDLYQMQWPNPEIPLSETLSAMMDLVEQGKVKNIGVSNLTFQQLEASKKICGDMLVSMQTEYNVMNRGIENEIMPYCEKSGITLIAYSPLNRWSLKFTAQERKLLEGLCLKYSASVPQILLNWLISHKGVIALTQTMSLKHIKENANAAKFSLDKYDAEAIDKCIIRTPVMVSTQRIQILNQDADETHQIYTSLEEALENRMNIQPSPEALSEEIKLGSMLRPVELIKIKDKSSRFDYYLTQGRMRYWAWIIAYGKEISIPAYVIN
jgi:aryl-alcohol dehydrogenase-like predicted oxidoreductase